MPSRHDLRNLAIVAHVDHGKTTLIDAMLRQSGAFRANQAVADRVLDSMDLEREKGITILAKHTAVRYRGVTLNIVDTPGHADFGGEVERGLAMTDGVLLLVDAAEGPLPQTRFVLRKSLEARLPIVVVLNKVDRPDARPPEVLDAVYDLFIDLGADENQIDFPVAYACARTGWAVRELPEDHAGDAPPAGSDGTLAPLLDLILDHVPPPSYEENHPLQALVTNLDASPYLGRLALCRIVQGSLHRGATVAWCRRDGSVQPARVRDLLVTEALDRVPAESAGAGDIVAVAGLPDVTIGETLADPDDPRPLPLLRVDEPSISMTFGVNTSPLAGRGGTGSGPGRRDDQRGSPATGRTSAGRNPTAGRNPSAGRNPARTGKLTARLLKARLDAELVGNVSIRVLPTERPDTWEVQGRGELALAVLVELMRREGFELTVGKPQVVTRMVDGRWCEPVERLEVDVPEEYFGAMTQLLAQRNGRLQAVTQAGSTAASHRGGPAASHPASTAAGHPASTAASHRGGPGASHAGATAADHASPGTGWARMEYRIPARGLIGLRTEVLSQTRGMAQLHHAFDGWEPWTGELRTRQTGSLVADREGVTTGYALLNLQQRGTLFVAPGEPVYEGMVIGESARGEDMDVNPTRERKLTNMRSSTAEELVQLSPARRLSLEAALELITDDEAVEVTPDAVRVRKLVRPAAERGRQRARARTAGTA